MDSLKIENRFMKSQISEALGLSFVSLYLFGDVLVKCHCDWLSHFWYTLSAWDVYWEGNQEYDLVEEVQKQSCSKITMPL